MAPKCGVLGGGAFGTALAFHLGRAGHETRLWAREKALVDRINRTRENSAYLPGVRAPDNVVATNNIEVALAAEFILLVVPTPYLEATLAPAVSHIRPGAILVSCAKGILNGTLETAEQLLHRVLPEEHHPRLAFLSGPSFAKEVAAGKPTMVTVASRDEKVARQVQGVISTTFFRCYRTTDVMGVELGGALKNVLAIACGISDGLDLGSNARAAIITRGLCEVTSIATAMGADPITMLGLGGIGDLVLTCTGDLSRNRTVGLRIGKGEKLDDITHSMGGAVAEGVLTSRSAYELARRMGTHCPTIEAIYRVIHEGADPVCMVAENIGCEMEHEVPHVLQRAASRAGGSGAAICSSCGGAGSGDAPSAAGGGERGAAALAHAGAAAR
ncbi:MAG: NAD-dependent glycerol-3-phosphate dehydrogenase [Monoraphidium minutum]|nr:MAG: NAD-dependent glycerol-3-phosphate dehydrogenase [Monoraphidium minutum]